MIKKGMVVPLIAAFFLFSSIVFLVQAGAGVHGTVNCITFSGPDIMYIGGQFDSVGGVWARNVAKWNGSAWGALGRGLNGTWDGVRSLAADGKGDLFVNGSFDTAGSLPARGIAYWNGSGWVPVLLKDTSGIVNDIVSDGRGGVYAGGHFSSIGGVTAKSIAYWNGSSWSALGKGSDTIILKLCFDTKRNILYTVSPQNYTTIQTWDGLSWKDIGSAVYHVDAMMVADNGDLYVAGGQFKAGANPPQLGRLSATWSIMKVFYTFQDNVNTLCFDTPGNLWAGGDFYWSNNTGAMKLDTVNGTWSKTPLTNNVNVLIKDPKGILFAGGTFGLELLMDSSWQDMSSKIRYDNRIAGHSSSVSPVFRIVNSRLLFSGVLPGDHVSLFSPSGRCLWESHGFSVIDLAKTTSTQPVMIWVTRNKQTILTGLAFVRR